MNSLLSFPQLVLNWYHKNGRKDLPWTIKNSPYHTWISEIMLQQTQIKTVIPYYKKFVKTFPNIHVLANSSINDILKIWSGLGYYTRAHNLYSTAKIIIKNYNGKFPNNFFDIIKLPGIGRTTAGAILSFGFNFYACILDGNIKRVLLRYFSIHANTSIKIEKKLWSKVELITPIYNTNKFNQAMIDIGSLICSKHKPKCNICPINKKCISYIKNDWSTYPIIKRKIVTTKRNIFFLIIQHQHFIFLNKHKFNNIWKGLYCFPIFHSQKDVLRWIKRKKITIKNQEIFPSFLHKLLHLQLLCVPIHIKVKTPFLVDTKSQCNIWLNILKPSCIGFPSPIQKIFKTHFFFNA
ncbi:MAG: A/G-specific adenine glycosylase [Buchnera aphidicola (Meitanaphis microgallis)]